MIYNLALVLDRPIDLWPKVKRSGGWRSWRLRQANRRRLSQELNLKLLGVSKQVCEEAAETLFGQNTFRFTNINGWVVFSCFLFTIGAQNYKYLRHVGIHVPFLGEELSGASVDWERRTIDSMTSYQKFCGVMGSMHLSMPPATYWWNHRVNAVKDCCKVLTKVSIYSLDDSE